MTSPAVSDNDGYNVGMTATGDVSNAAVRPT
jgi:hypothetical protein